jgi:dolichol kinase
MPTASTIQSAEHEYNRRLELLHASELKLKQRDTLFGYAKLFLLLGGLVMAFWLLIARSFSIFWILLPAFLLVLFAVIHERVIRALKKCGRSISFYERGLARIRGEWMGKGEAGERFSDPSHPYARDLDLFGAG